MTELEFCQIFADNLRYEIMNSGYSHYELAFESYLDESTINKCLKGDRIPSVRTLVNLACALECDITDLIPDHDYVN